MNISANLNPYWILLKDLDTRDKLSLIELLVKSIQSSSKISEKNIKKSNALEDSRHWVFDVAGSWNDFPETAEELIALTQGTRTLGRQI